MSHLIIHHDFDAEPARFWKVFFHEPYNVDMYRRLKVKERNMLYRKEEADTVSFQVRIMPERDLPGFMKKILGGDLGYTETSTFYLSKNYGDVKVEPTLMKERTKVRGVYRLTPLGPGKLRRTFEADIEVDLPLVGRKVEDVVIADTRRSYDVAAEVTREWLVREF